MNKGFASLIALVLASLLVSGCREGSNLNNDTGTSYPSAQPSSTTAAEAPAKPLRSEDLLHRRFALAEVNGKAFNIEEPAQRPEIEFNEGFQISGRVCNRFRGPAELNDGRLIAENLASTMMLCINSELDELERLFFAMLRAGADISLDKNDRLTLSQGEQTLVYEQADWVR
jgi:heat shock protein HslJ